MLLNLLQYGISGKAGTGIGDEPRNQPEFLKGNRAFADLRYGKEDSISHVALNFAATKGLLGKYTLHLCAEVLF